jgi:tetratricopeptide (TPR) repeat protein
MSSGKTKRAGREPQGLWSYFLPMLFSAGLGATVTWLVMSQRSAPVNRPVSFATPGVSQSVPAPDLSGIAPADAAVGRGNNAYDHQQWADAIREYESAIASGRDNADVRTDLGNAFRFSGQPDKALEQYTIAQRQNPLHENSLFNQIGLFAEVLRDPIRAIPVCEEFIRRFPASEKIPRVKEQLALAKSL